MMSLTFTSYDVLGTYWFHGPLVSNPSGFTVPVAAADDDELDELLDATTLLDEEELIFGASARV